MSGSPAFQATPNAFQANAFQTGNLLVAGDYSLGAPAFAAPALQVNFQLGAQSPYWLGSPVFATPPITEALIAILVNPYSLSSPSFSAPFLRSTQRFTVPAYSLGSPTFGAPALNQLHRFFVNTSALGSPDFAAPSFTHIIKFAAPLPFWLGSPTYEPPDAPIQVFYALTAPNYSLQSPSFGYPRLQWQVVRVPWPLTYHSSVEEAAAMLRKYLDILLSSIPPSPTRNRNTVRRLIAVLRQNAEAEIRGETLGSQLAEINLAADAAGANYSGVEQAREFLMTQVASRSTFTQIVFRGALIMTLALESKIVARTRFKTQTQARNMMLHMRDAFDAAKAIGIDEVDVLVYQAVATMGGALINHLALTELQLPRMVTYETAINMPSLYLANRIYQDTTRADEIEAENDVVHPAFMPRTLRVLSTALFPSDEVFPRPKPPVTY
jgi:hypothetical protein